MKTIHLAFSGREWHREVGERDNFQCAAKVHAKDCNGQFEHAHHIVYRSSLGNKKAVYVVENGIALSNVCHALAHETKNGNLDLERCNEAVFIINHFEKYVIQKFTRSKSRMA